MFRLTFLPALILPVIMLGMTANAQQNAGGQADSATQSQQQATDQQQAPSTPAAALPDDPGTTAGVKTPLQPTGPTAVIDTSMGRMTCVLYSKEAPRTTENFEGLTTGSKDWTSPVTHKKMHGTPLYNGTTFHRVIPGFMIQGGDPAGNGTGDPGYYVDDEISPNLNFDVPGRLAMANSGPNTNGSQFFITVTPQPSLDQHYSIFGQCDPASVLVAESITQVPRDGQDKPFEPVTIQKITIVPQGKPLPAAPAVAPAPPPAQP
ncbi:MAG: peptidylprolyl isomerase [Acidobacteriaceae bacterium]